MDLEDIITNEGLKELVRILPTKEEDFEKNIILKNEKNINYIKMILYLLLKNLLIYIT